MNQDEFSKTIKDVNQWTRVAYMVLFAVVLYLVSILLPVIVVVQILFALLTGSPNPNLRQFGRSLSTYIYQTVDFLTYNSEDKPFPFGPWPKPETGVETEVETEAVVVAEAEAEQEAEAKAIEGDAVPGTAVKNPE